MLKQTCASCVQNASVCAFVCVSKAHKSLKADMMFVFAFDVVKKFLVAFKTRVMVVIAFDFGGGRGGGRGRGFARCARFAMIDEWKAPMRA